MLDCIEEFYYGDKNKTMKNIKDINFLQQLQLNNKDLLLIGFDEEINFLKKDNQLMIEDEFKWEDIQYSDLQTRTKFFDMFAFKPEIKELFLYNLQPFYAILSIQYIDLLMNFPD